MTVCDAGADAPATDYDTIRDRRAGRGGGEHAPPNIFKVIKS